MVIDINLFRKEKGGNPEKIKESERKRFHDENNVDKVIEYDERWRKCIFQLEELKRSINAINKKIGNEKKQNKNANVDDLKKESITMKEEIPKIQNEEKFLLQQRNMYLSKIGNILSSEVVTSDNEDNNKVITQWGICKQLPVETDGATINTDDSDHNINKREDPICTDQQNNITYHSNNIIKNKNVVNNYSDNFQKEKILNDSKTIKTENKPKYYYHFDLLKKIGGANFKKGVQVAGHRGYFLTGAGFLLHNAILQYAINFLINKNYTPVYPPFFMKKNLMEECAELADFEETLYRIPASSYNNICTDQSTFNTIPKTGTNTIPKTGTNTIPTTGTNTISNEELTKDDLFLIATSEQPLCALHKDETFESKDLPIKYMGISSCFRKEAGAHGKDVRGILRVHQFDKIEQFCICLPQHSYKIHNEMIKTCEEFYQSLNIPYRVISIVSGALNNAAAIKYDLEGYFPSCNQFRELVSCSNCTDYQSINLNIKYSDSKNKLKNITTDISDDNNNDGNNKQTKEKQEGNDFSLNEEIDKEYEKLLQDFQVEQKSNVHLLNGTMVAAQRFLCCLLENYQNGKGIVVPEKLRPYMNNIKFIPFIR
ncbi:serine--tRNA ligase, putative [Hepatocystis sp. ex Piliocolobus tephrosceles]|nr:serine--tRNA ligase, putative [Hepatocystis sp. ex Piliocolobus tephrosceles]